MSSPDIQRRPFGTSTPPRDSRLALDTGTSSAGAKRSLFAGQNGPSLSPAAKKIRQAEVNESVPPHVAEAWQNCQIKVSDASQRYSIESHKQFSTMQERNSQLFSELMRWVQEQQDSDQCRIAKLEREKIELSTKLRASEQKNTLLQQQAVQQEQALSFARTNLQQMQETLRDTQQLVSHSGELSELVQHLLRSTLPACHHCYTLGYSPKNPIITHSGFCQATFHQQCLEELKKDENATCDQCSHYYAGGFMKSLSNSINATYRLASFSTEPPGYELISKLKNQSRMVEALTPQLAKLDPDLVKYLMQLPGEKPAAQAPDNDEDLIAEESDSDSD